MDKAPITDHTNSAATNVVTQNDASDNWIDALKNQIGSGRITEQPDSDKLACIHWKVAANSWEIVAKEAHALNARWAAGWADHQLDHSGEVVIDQFSLFVLFVIRGRYVLVETQLENTQDDSLPEIASHSAFYPGASRCERHTSDMFGICFNKLDKSIDSRRWTRHQAWKEDEYPLRHGFPLEGHPRHRTPADGEYPFERIDGISVYEIPVGPIHAGVIEPGHFRFSAAGEDIIQLEQHLAYVHKGIEKLAVGRDPAALARLAGRVSGDSTVAHGWAACQAMESAAEIEIPERASALRGLLCERERVANHLGDIGAICNDVGFAFAHIQFGRLRELWQRRSQQLFKHRFMMDNVIPGGVVHDISEENATLLNSEISALIEHVSQLANILEDNASLMDRLVTTGYLSEQTARRFGALGYVARASGMDDDVRLHKPYPPYQDNPLNCPLLEQGDVASRLKIRVQEVVASLQFQRKLLRNLPEGPISMAFEAPVNTHGLGILEGWRGEIVTYVRFDHEGKIARFYPRDPSWFNWPCLQQIVKNNIVPDFPVCNKSVNGSYSGVDL